MYENMIILAEIDKDFREKIHEIVIDTHDNYLQTIDEQNLLKELYEVHHGRNEYPTIRAHVTLPTLDSIFKYLAEKHSIPEEFAEEFVEKNEEYLTEVMIDDIIIEFESILGCKVFWIDFDTLALNAEDVDLEFVPENVSEEYAIALFSTFIGDLENDKISYEDSGEIQIINILGEFENWLIQELSDENIVNFVKVKRDTVERFFHLVKEINSIDPDRWADLFEEKFIKEYEKENTKKMIIGVIEIMKLLFDFEEDEEV